MRKPQLGFFCETQCDTPSKLFLLKLKLCYANAVDAVFFSAKQLDKENEVVEAYSWTKDGLAKEITAIPHLVEYGGGTKMRNYFRVRCTLIDDFNLSKEDINNLLIRTEFANSVIPSLYTKIPEKALDFLNIWNEVMIKPLAGARGEGIFSLKNSTDGNYVLTDTTKEIGTLTHKECIEFLTNEYKGTKVIVQPRLSFKNKDGNTMDFRINVTKDGEGKWQTIFIIPRTAREKIISNFSQGGYASLLEPSLEIDYPYKKDIVYSELMRVAEKLPSIVEEASGCMMLSLGIDLGFDYDTLNPYIIEVNYVPKLTFPDKLKYHYIQSEYFAYIVNKFRNNTLN